MTKANMLNFSVPSAFVQRKEGAVIVVIFYDAESHIDAPMAWNLGEKEWP